MSESFPLQPLDFCFFEVELSASTVVVGVGNAGDEGRGKVGRQAEGRHCLSGNGLTMAMSFLLQRMSFIYRPLFPSNRRCADECPAPFGNGRVHAQACAPSCKALVSLFHTSARRLLSTRHPRSRAYFRVITVTLRKDTSIESRERARTVCRQLMQP